VLTTVQLPSRKAYTIQELAKNKFNSPECWNSATNEKNQKIGKTSDCMPALIINLPAISTATIYQQSVSSPTVRNRIIAFQAIDLGTTPD